MADKKVALITGTSSGFGLITAIELARAGYRVIATMRDPAKKERLMSEAKTTGVADSIEVRRLDVTKFDELPGIVGEIVRDRGRIDVLVNNAGYALAGFAEDISHAELQQQLDTNFFGAVEIDRKSVV